MASPDPHPRTWEEVARIHGRRIYTYAYRLTGNPDDAADLAQEVLLRVRRGLAGYTPGSFEAWLWRITHNTFVDEYRRRKRRPTVPLPDEPDRFDRGASPPADEVLASIRLGDDVQEALRSIPEDFRVPILMCDVVGLSYEEIAEALDVPIGTVRSRIHRGRKRLREVLG